jgi:hypothetical protein
MLYEVLAKLGILAGIRLVDGKLFNVSADSFNNSGVCGRALVYIEKVCQNQDLPNFIL